MSDAKIFSKIDLKEAYSQIELSKNSRKMTNFITEERIIVSSDSFTGSIQLEMFFNDAYNKKLVT